ncbi:hypothetical protein ACA910_001094 [Epithemia clementina (nom. ined.)]
MKEKIRTATRDKEQIDFRYSICMKAKTRQDEMVQQVVDCCPSQKLHALQEEQQKLSSWLSHASHNFEQTHQAKTCCDTAVSKLDRAARCLEEVKALQVKKKKCKERLIRLRQEHHQTQRESDVSISIEELQSAIHNIDRELDRTTHEIESQWQTALKALENSHKQLQEAQAILQELSDQVKNDVISESGLILAIPEHRLLRKLSDVTSFLGVVLRTKMPQASLSNLMLDLERLTCFLGQREQDCRRLLGHLSEVVDALGGAQSYVLGQQSQIKGEIASKTKQIFEDFRSQITRQTVQSK